MFKKILIMVSIATTPFTLMAQEGLLLEQKIGQMLMVGFHGTTAPKSSQICKDIKRYNVGSVILFDYNPVNKNKPKNIATKKQLAKLTKELQDKLFGFSLDNAHDALSDARACCNCFFELQKQGVIHV